jgi:hypothetical protein
MIHDISEFSRTGVVCRRVDELDVPVGAWRAAMCHAGRRQGVRVRTFLMPHAVVDANDPRNRLVCAVRTDPPPDPAVQRKGMVRWWRVGELNMPFERWRTAMRGVAHHTGAQIHTFRGPPATGLDEQDQLVYAVWADPADFHDVDAAPPTTFTEFPPLRQLPVTNLADYAAGRSHRAASMSRHPSQHSDTDVNGRG